MAWIERILEQWGKLRLADEAKDLADNQKVLAADRAVVDAHNRRNFGESYRPEAEADDVIHVGDSVQHVYPAPPAPAPSSLPKLLLGAGLLATGVGGPLGAWFVADALRSRPAAVQSTTTPAESPAAEQTPVPEPPPVVAPPSAASDRDFEIRLGPTTRQGQ